MAKQKNNIRIILLLILILPVILWSGTTGKIAGMITDKKSGEPMAGVNVFLEKKLLGASTDISGQYAIINIPPGTYTVVAQMMGAAEVKMKNVVVSVDKTTLINFELSEDYLELEEEITIIAERPMLQKDLTSTTYTVSSEQMDAMPVENLEDVLTLKAGIVKDAAGNIHFRGGRSSEVSYLVDGIPVTNVTTGQPMFEIEKDILSQLEVISGTFNAEYGQALSGIVNAITSDGSEVLDIKADAYFGDYLSSHTYVFPNTDDPDANHIKNMQLSISKPFSLFGQKIYTTFFARQLINNGWIYGTRRFNPSDSSNFSNPNEAYIEESGDGTYISMNPDTKQSLSAKLVYKYSPTLKFSYSLYYNNHEYQVYNHLFKLNPDGRLKYFEDGQTHLFKINQSLSNNLFYDISLAYLKQNTESHVYENPYDSRYQLNEELYPKGNSFLTGGTEMTHNYRENITAIIKGDLSYQFNNVHFFKTGFDFKYYKLHNEAYTIQKSVNTDYEALIPEIESPYHNMYTHYPIEFAVYFQDKIELGDLIVNAGLRFDYFDSKGKIPLDFRDPNNRIKELEGERYKDAEAKYQLSPRIGLSYPMSTKSILRASYGHFFQIPQFDYLFANPEFEVIPNSLSTRTGNADFEPQRTTTYEVGLQQELTGNWVLDVTGFVKDIRNLTGQEIYELYVLGDRYARYVNRDFGTVRGLTFSINKMHSDYWGLSFDYTYQIAKGNASDPDQVFQANQSTPPAATEKQLAPLDWDQRHTINFAVSLGQLEKWGINLLGRFGSGMPYTPEQSDERSSIENSARKPVTYTFDTKLYYRFTYWGIQSELYVNIYNLLDRLNELTVYTDTGRAGFNLSSLNAGGTEYVNTIQEYVNRPNFYSEPRRIQVGISFSFQNEQK